MYLSFRPKHHVSRTIDSPYNNNNNKKKKNKNKNKNYNNNFFFKK